MIPVALQPEPANFDAEVRQPGHAWLAARGIPLTAAPPTASTLPPYWSATNKQLWDAYAGICAYLAIFFEWPTGASSTDHFIAKSRSAGDAYEWANYRLACLGANRAKGAFNDVMDPIGLPPDTFFLNLSNGHIRPMRGLPPAHARAAEKTIRRLKLDSEENRRMRARHYSDYLRHNDPATLKFYSPFVWYEASRQGLL